MSVPAHCRWFIWVLATYAALARPVSAQEDDLGESDDAAETRTAQAPGAADDQDEADSAHDDAASVESARAHFQRGVDYYGEGDFRAALIEFERSYALQHAYRLLYNLGQTAYELRDYAAAEHYFTDYLTQGGSEVPAERRMELERELARLLTRVSSLRIRPNLPGAMIRIDDHPVTPAELKSGIVRVSAGQRHVVAEKAGYGPVHKLVDVVGGEVLLVPLQFGRAMLSDSNASTRHSGPPWPWVTGIASGVVALSAAGFSYAAYSDSMAYSDQLQVITTPERLQQLSSRLKTKALIADVLWGTAAVGAVVTVVLAVSGNNSEPKPDTDGTISFGASSFTVRW
jgi:tetratricopeptide (TPR) repeat protein